MTPRAYRTFVTLFLVGLPALHLGFVRFRPRYVADGDPEFAGLPLWRTLVLALLSAAFVGITLRYRRGGPAVACDPTPAWVSGFAVIAGLAPSLFLFSPKWFYVLAKEDHPVEYASAALAFLAGALCLSVAVRVWRVGRTGSLAVFGLGALLIVIGLEEVSWFQRVLGFSPPTAFDTNLQKEFNLHNFATDTIEALYYYAAFVFLVVLPFIQERTGLLSARGALAVFAPTPIVLAGAAAMTAYNYDMWNLHLTQVGFFITALILLSYALRGRRQLRGAWFALLTVHVLSQCVFLVRGDLFWRSWDVTEYKELWIPAAFVVYALDLAWRVLGSRTAPSLGRADSGEG